MQDAFQTIWLGLCTSPFSSPFRVLVMSIIDQRVKISRLQANLWKQQNYFYSKICQYVVLPTKVVMGSFYWINVSWLGQTKLKRSFWSSCLVIFLPSENTQTDRQIITKRYYDRKYIHIQTVMLLNMPKTWKICIIEVINYGKIDVET